MPHQIVLDELPAGVVVDPGTGEGSLARVAVREFTSSEDGEQLITRLEGIPSQILAKVSPMFSPSTIDHLVAIINRDKSATVYVNECPVFVRARLSRTKQAGEPIYEHEIVDIDSLVFHDVTFSKTAGILIVFSAGWRKGLFFDFDPIGPERRDRDYDLEKLLGSYMAYLRSQRLFSLADSDWAYLIERQWFPFVSLAPSLKQSLVALAKERRDLDRLLPEASKHVRSLLAEMLTRWENSKIFEPHIGLLKHAGERFQNNDFVSCTAVLYPRIEGLLRTLHEGLGLKEKASQTVLSATAISGRKSELHPFSLLLPDMFRRYLEEAYFAAFEPGQPAALSRNSIGHGVAAVEQFDEKGAVLGLLTVDQLFYFLPERSDGPHIT